MESHLTYTISAELIPVAQASSRSHTIQPLYPYSLHMHMKYGSVHQLPSVLLGVEMHCESRASQPRLQHNHFSPGLETRPLDLKSSMSIHTQASASLDTGRKAYPPHKYQLSLFQDTNICKYLFEQILHQ